MLLRNNFAPETDWSRVAGVQTYKLAAFACQDTLSLSSSYQTPLTCLASTILFAVSHEVLHHNRDPLLLPACGYVSDGSLQLWTRSLLLRWSVSMLSMSRDTNDTCLLTFSILQHSGPGSTRCSESPNDCPHGVVEEPAAAGNA